MKKKTVDNSEVVDLLAKYGALLNRGRDRRVRHVLNLVDLSILHSVVCLGMEHPEFRGLGTEGEEVVGRFRDFFKRVWITQGLSPDEADMMDRIKQEFDEVV